MKQLLFIIFFLMLVSVCYAGPPSSPPSPPTAGLITTHNADTTSVHGIASTATLHTFVAQTASLGNNGVLTPTPGYDYVPIALTCTDNPSTIIMTEGGNEKVNSLVAIVNVDTNPCVFPAAAGVVVLPQTVTLNKDQALLLHRVSDRWVAAQSYPIVLSSIAAGVVHPPVTNSKSGAYVIGTDSAAEAYGGMIYVTSAATITAPAVVAGMNFCVATIGATAVSLDMNTSDKMILNGVELHDGDKATNTSTTGDMICCTYYSADGFWCLGSSVDGDPWTDGGA